MVIAVIAVWVMQTTLDEIVDVISMGHLLVTALGPVLVTRIMTRSRSGALSGMLVIHGNPMLVDVVVVGVVQVSIVQVIRVAVVSYRHVAALRTMLVIMVGMDGMLDLRHVAPSRATG